MISIIKKTDIRTLNTSLIDYAQLADTNDPQSLTEYREQFYFKGKGFHYIIEIHKPCKDNDFFKKDNKSLALLLLGNPLNDEQNKILKHAPVIVKIVRINLNTTPVEIELIRLENIFVFDNLLKEDLSIPDEDFYYGKRIDKNGFLIRLTENGALEGCTIDKTREIWDRSEQVESANFKDMIIDVASHLPLAIKWWEVYQKSFETKK